LRRSGIVHEFTGELAGTPYEPVDSTLVVASSIAQAFLGHRNVIRGANAPRFPSQS